MQSRDAVDVIIFLFGRHDRNKVFEHLPDNHDRLPSALRDFVKLLFRLAAVFEFGEDFFFGYHFARLLFLLGKRSRFRAMMCARV